MIGVDEHCWRHTRRGDTYVTVIIDLTPIRDGTGPARLLDMVEGNLALERHRPSCGAGHSTSRDGGNTDGTADLTCEDSTRHHPLDGWEPTRNRKVV